MCRFPTDRPRRRERRAIALLITLAMLAIASIVLVAFVTSVRLDRTATFSYSQSLKTDQLARGALQLVVGQLRQEMAKDAPPDTGGGAYPLRPVYTNLTATNVAPQPVGTNAAMPLLVKVSSTNAPFTGTSLSGSLLATPVGATAASLNGRSVPLSRWNQAYLGTFPSAASAPDWVLVTRSGVTNGAGLAFGSAGNTLNNPALANTNYAVGRFAYAVYDTGGLLDVTVAGHPSSLTAAQLQLIKGTLAGADLSGLGLNADALVSWRNAASAASAAAYLGYVTNFAATNGFLSVTNGDTTFLGRQDLIAAAQNGVAGLTPALLTNLTVFSREKEAPSWGPATPAGSTFDYAAAANLASATNRFVPLLRYANGGTVHSFQADGTAWNYAVQAGDLLVRHRFPLARLAWIGPGGPQNGGNDAAIQACFGLKWDTSTTDDHRTIHLWKYVGPGGATELGAIETLAQVAAEAAPREPNFFELLQAGILSGSLGVDAGATTLASVLPVKAPLLQIFRIGACLIDQSSPAATPTVIEYSQSGDPWQAVGVKSLPYINTVEGIAGCASATPPALGATVPMPLYLVFGLWNPGYPGTALGAAAPVRPNVRLRLQGSFGVHNAFNAPTFGTSTIMPLPIPSSTIALATTAGNGANGFSDPGLLKAADVAGAPGAGTVAGQAWATTPPLGVNSATYVGYRLPDLTLTNAPSSVKATGVVFHYSIDATNPFTVALEFQNPLGEWIPYHYAAGINDQAVTGLAVSQQNVVGLLVNTLGVAPSQTYTLNKLPLFAGTANSIGPSLAVFPLFMTGDPRSLRFGLWQFDRSDHGPVNNTGPTTAGEDSRLWRQGMAVEDPPNPNNAFQAAGYGGDPSIGQFQNAPAGFGSFYFPAALARNNTANTAPTSSYLDKDGVRRIGDSGLYPSSQSYAAGNPFAGAAVRPQDRPVVLNRPFASVGEMGYAFRDDPWRSLDFFSAGSADAGLLDLFTTDAGTNAFTAGKISLNGQNAAALAAVLGGTPADVVAGAAISQPASIAAALTNATAAMPLVNKADLALRFGPSLAAANFSATDEQNIKAQREASLRALADVGQTRTWNLMIDLVAQSGRFPAPATGLSQFVVEGERRYWLHVALDRITGEIVDQRIEAVNN